MVFFRVWGKKLNASFVNKLLTEELTWQFQSCRYNSKTIQKNKNENNTIKVGLFELSSPNLLKFLN